MLLIDRSTMGGHLRLNQTIVLAPIDIFQAISLLVRVAGKEGARKALDITKLKLFSPALFK